MRTKRVKLTQRTLDAALRGDRSTTNKLRCHDVPGFSASVHTRSVSFDFEYRMRGTDPATGKRPATQTWRIGDATTYALGEAREIARGLRHKVQQGIDPKRERAEAEAAARVRQQAAAAEAAARLSCAERLSLYRSVLTTRGRSLRYQDDELRHVRLGLASAGVLDLTPAEITPPVLERITAASPVNTRHARFSAIGRFLDWACKGSGALPATRLFDKHERPRPPAARQRVLSGFEVAAIWRATETLQHPVIRDLVQLVLAIPCRRGEAAAMRWQDIDFEARIWRQPTTKSGDPHLFSLNARAMEVLARRATGGRGPDFVFPGPRYRKPFAGWSNLIESVAARIDPATPVATGWRLHDIRRAFVTHLAEQGHDESALDLCINHRASATRGGIRGVYQRAHRWAERVAALDAWNSFLDTHIGANVLPLRRTG